MVGMLLWRAPERGKRSVFIRERSVLHTRFLCAEVARGPRTPEAVARRRTAAALRRLRKRGVAQAVLPEDFPWREVLDRSGLRPVSTLPLRRAIAADCVRWSLRQRELPAAGARVAVWAAALTGDVVRAVTELALRHRYVLLALPYGGEELARQLRREYGVSLLLVSGREQLEAADAVVCFDPPPEGAGPGWLSLWDEAAPLPPLSLPPALEEQLPAGVRRDQLLAALREAGSLRPGQLSVGI